MQRFLTPVLAAAAAALIAAVGFAFAKPTPTYPGRHLKPLGTLISAQGLAAPRALTVTNATHNLLVLLINYTHNNNGNVTMTCTGSNDDNATDYALQSITVASGVGTSVDASWSNAVTTDEDFVWRVDMTGLPDAECTIDHSAGDASDIITVYGYLTTD
jgi:hypothetical protein